MRKKLLLVNCYREKADEKIGSYHVWLKAGANAAGMELDVHEMNDRDAFPAAGEFSALVISGSQKMVGDNETEPGLLEFLGDAILGMAVCGYLYRRFPDYLEGEMTKIKSAVVSRRTCALIARELGLPEGDLSTLEKSE